MINKGYDIHNVRACRRVGSIYLNVIQYEELRDFAYKTRMSQSEIIRCALAEFMTPERMEQIINELRPN